MRTNIPGHFKHSYSGDILEPSVKWGLIQTILAIKILTILNDEDYKAKFNSKILANSILKFEKKNGLILDPLINSKGYFLRLKNSVRTFHFSSLFYNKEAVAMTRSSYNALMLINRKPTNHYRVIPYSEESIHKYINRLNWAQPWQAGSHFSHLLFFLNIEKKSYGMGIDEYRSFIDISINSLNKYFNNNDVVWLLANNNDYTMSVNGIMKICMALNITNKLDYFSNPDRIIDMCLREKTEGSACDFFNVLYTLHSMQKLTDYKHKEIKKYCINLIETIKKFYWVNEKGFSFLQGKAESYYYGYRFTQGKPEPDLHGTAMYLWALSLINDICKFDLNLNSPIT